MRKLPIYVLTAAAALAAAGAVPATAYAAVNTYPTANGKMVVIGGNLDTLKEMIGQTGSQNGFENCDPVFPGIGFPEINFPGVNIPGSNIPDNSLPQPEFPIPDFPGDSEGNDQESGSQDAFVAEVVRLVNGERAKAGIAPLTVNKNAERAAGVRAKEIKTSFSHTRPDGRSFTTALTEAGASFSKAGENIAWGQKTPEEVMKSWMNSSGHRANILNSDFTSIGVGHQRGADGVDYWTQLFIR